MARLLLSLDGQVLAEYNMSKERYTVGRLQDNDIRIDNPTISGHHSLIINILNDSFLEDLNSTNGTYVNGRLIKKHALQNGDVVTVGRHQLRFLDGTADEEDEFASTMVIERQAGGMESLAKAAALSASMHSDSSAGSMSAGSMSAGSNGAAPSPAAVRPAGAEPAAKRLAIAKVQVLNGSFQGREITLNKALTTLGRPGAQVVAITRRADGYHLVQVENKSDKDQPRLNGQELGPQARKLADNDVIEIIGTKMGFFLT